MIGSRAARGAANDLRLINLCDQTTGVGCSWVVKSPTGNSVDLARDPSAPERFRSLMSELGVAIAPRLQTPADTLGFAGFQLSAELGMTQISRDKAFWNAIEGVDAANPSAHRPDAWLTTLGGFVRKGLFLPVSMIELGAGAVNVLHSQMWAMQGYAKIALHEGFHDWPLPSLAVRGGFSRLIGTDQVALTVGSVDVLVSKAFSVSGTARLEPFGGWDFLFISAKSGVIDGTPGCDAARLQRTDPKDPAAILAIGPQCDARQAGTAGDYGSNFSFPSQSAITRHRIYGGFKLRLHKLFAVLEGALSPAGRSRDKNSPQLSARDNSGSQQSYSLSTGFDF